MQLNDMAPAVLTIVLIGIVIGVGIITLDRFGVAVKTSTPIINETIAITSGTGQTTNDDLTSLSYFGNSTPISTDMTTIVITEQVNWTNTGAITINTGNFSTDGNFDISYVYDRDSAATTAVFSARNATDDFVTWLPVIIIIIAAAIILGLVLGSFRQ